MGFDDYFEHKSKYRKFNQYYGRRHYSGHEYSSMHEGGYDRGHHGLNIVNKILSNRKLRLIFIVVALFIVLVIVALLIAIFPLIIRVFDYIAQSGLKGITETVTGFIDKLWSGSGN